MLRLIQPLGRRLLGSRGVKTWHKDLEAPLKRVGARIDAALQLRSQAQLLSQQNAKLARLQELAVLRPKSVEW